MICKGCSRPFEQLGTGRPRKYCTTCRPRRLDPHRHGACGCGRDYLTVPLEQAHLCTNPIKDDDHAAD